ncbi:CHAP domain-containing protein [Kovacikia minuta CCNUW1]|uniref:CHAP domain-containing protein n=1 Tax=Kovacikia minuta TaxID=2931930 RepID=UPI001CC95003|nr:CHAP domain-containing protein [Kovacikia minuta]UBF26693.1 CHAP domain-containing protein [Kovacikia minuta CCNUW1]
MTTPQDVLSIAARQIGITESPPDSNMNKFGAWYGMNGVPWCAIFVSYCFSVAGLRLPITTEKGFAYCPFGVDWFKDQRRWFNTPQVGDVVFYNWSGDGIADHVGIVESINADGSVVSIEGNTDIGNEGNGGKVMRRTRGKSVQLGFGRPTYSTFSTVDNSSIFPGWPGYYITLTSPSVSRNDVVKWQQQMISRGWKLGSGGPSGKGDTGIFDQRCFEVLKKFQEEKGLEVDGILGPESWDAAWTAPITP